MCQLPRKEDSGTKRREVVHELVPRSRDGRTHGSLLDDASSHSLSLMRHFFLLPYFRLKIASFLPLSDLLLTSYLTCNTLTPIPPPVTPIERMRPTKCTNACQMQETVQELLLLQRNESQSLLWCASPWDGLCLVFHLRSLV